MATGRHNNLVEIVGAEASTLSTFLSCPDEKTWASESPGEGWPIVCVVADLAGHIDN